MERKLIALLKKMYHYFKGDQLVQKLPINITLHDGYIKQKPPGNIILDDEYINWLCFANAGMLHRGNLYCIEYAVKHLNSNNPVIEVGSFCGLSTNIINYYLNKYNKNNKIITSDKWEFEGASSDGLLGNSIISHTDYKEFVKDSFKRNVQLFSSFNLPYPIPVFSDDFFHLWKNNTNLTDIFERNIQLGGVISFAFIDGNHTYDFAKRDFENVDKFLETGGFVLFDDSSDDSTFECRYLMKEIEINPNYELIIKNPNYLFKKIAA